MEIMILDSKEPQTVSPAVFDLPFNEGMVHQVVVSFLAGARQGSHAQKTRSEVAGGGRKPWRQKGTGRARAGTIRSPIWRGGGKAFAAKPRNYTQKVNRKVYRGALCSILSEHVRRSSLLVVDSFDMSTPKTKELSQKLKELSVNNVLIVGMEISENLYLAARNLHQVKVQQVDAIDPVSLLAHEHVVMTLSALKKIEEKLQ